MLPEVDALKWANEQQARGRLQDPCVIGAHVALGRCFDLLDTDATAQLRVFYEDLRSQLDRVGEAMPENGSTGSSDLDLTLRFLDCAVINIGLRGIEKGRPHLAYQTVRGAFQEGAEAFRGAKIQEKTHLQIAVRDSSCILGYFLPTGYTLFERKEPTHDEE